MVVINKKRWVNSGRNQG